MKIISTEFNGLFILHPQVFADARGYFYESYNRKVLEAAGIAFDFVQDNQSESAYGVIRGLHYQLDPHAQTKLVRVLQGRIYDVAVDIRKGSPTFGKWFGIELSGANKIQLLIPRGFAHGFSVLSKKALVLYKTDHYYRKEAERGILYDDPVLNIDWKLNPGAIRISEKDLKLSGFELLETNFTW